MREFAHRGSLHAPGFDRATVEEAAHRWTAEDMRVEPSPTDLSEGLPRRRPLGAVFARNSFPVTRVSGYLRFPTPAPPVVLGLQPFLRGVASYQIRSATPGDPDGVILTQDEQSARLVAAGSTGPRRVTAEGVAERTNIASSQLVQLPLLGWQEAVAAPLVTAGFSSAPSDKGRFHQRTLELAGGLRFLAWALWIPAKQPSARPVLRSSHG